MLHRLCYESFSSFGLQELEFSNRRVLSFVEVEGSPTHRAIPAPMNGWIRISVEFVGRRVKLFGFNATSEVLKALILVAEVMSTDPHTGHQIPTPRSLAISAAWRGPQPNQMLFHMCYGGQFPWI